MTLNAKILLIYCVLTYVNIFILVYFLRFQEGGGPGPPPKSATAGLVKSVRKFFTTA